jgi:type II secretory pathway component GspD/PulD (secretin)
MKHLVALLVSALLVAATPSQNDPVVSLDVRDAPISDVIALLAKESDANIVADQSVQQQRITLRLRNVRFLEALRMLAAAHGLSVRMRDGIVLIGTDSLERNTVVLPLVHAASDDVVKEIVSMLPAGATAIPDRRINAVVVTAGPQAIARARRVIEQLDGAPQATGEPRTRIYRLRFTQAQEVVKELKALLPDGIFVSDDVENAVLVGGGDEAQLSAASAIGEIDVAGPEVLFEVRVADVTPENDSSDVGLEFGGLDLQGNPLTGATTYAFTGKTVALNVRLNALVTNGQAQILATPRLVTLNGKEADLLIGQTYPIVYTTSVLGGSNVQFVDIGVKLRLTPIIGPDGTVTAELHPEYSELQGFTSSGYPIIANRKIDSTLRVGDGQTIVLGGLLRDASSVTVQRVPWLSQIPLLGTIFNDKQASHERDEIVFLITPHIIKSGSLPAQ